MFEEFGKFLEAAKSSCAHGEYNSAAKAIRRASVLSLVEKGQREVFEPIAACILDIAAKIQQSDDAGGSYLEKNLAYPDSPGTNMLQAISYVAQHDPISDGGRMDDLATAWLEIGDTMCRLGMTEVVKRLAAQTSEALPLGNGNLVGTVAATFLLGPQIF